MKEPPTNAEKLVHMCDYIQLGQFIILHALIKEVDNILENKEEVLKSMENHIFNGEAWVRSAQEIKDYLNNLREEAGK